VIGYPCPVCLTPADLETGCPGCGRPPDPQAARVIELDAALRVAHSEAEAAGRAYATATVRVTALRRERDGLGAQVAARAAHERAAAAGGARTPPPGPAAAPGPAVAPAGAAPAPQAAEASTRTVQNVLFVLGGLLLATAAVVFTVVAWANVGIAGKAVILATVTAVTLAGPPLAVRRGLPATAETFAVLGLLLVLLDGYAAWRVNLGGVAGASTPTRYAGAVLALTAVLAAGYGRAVRLVGPRYVALLLAQPALPLLVSGAGLGAAGWAAVFAAVAAGDVALARLVRPPAPAVSAVLAGAASVVAGALAVLAVVLARDVPQAGRAGTALVLVAGVLLAAGLATGVGAVARVAAAVALVATQGALAGVLVLARPGLALVLVAGLVAATAVAVSRLPARLRSGLDAGSLVAMAPVALSCAAAALYGGATTLALALPPWRADLGRYERATALFDWQLPVALGLLAAGVAAVAAAVSGRSALGPVGRYPLAAAATLAALALPVCTPLPYWAPSTVDGLVAVPLALSTVYARSGRRAAVPGVLAAGLGGHAVATALARPGSGALALAAFVALAGVVAVPGLFGRPATAPTPAAPARATGPAAPAPAPWAHPAGVGAVAALLGLLAVPALAATTAAALREGAPARGGAALPAWAAVGGVLLAAAVTGVLRRWAPPYALAGLTATGLAATVVTVAVPPATRAPASLSSALLLAAVLGAGLAVLPALRRGSPGWVAPATAVTGGLLALPALGVLVALAPAAWSVLAAPYGWLGAVWSGRPTGVGLAPHGGWYGERADAGALGVLAAAAAVLGYRRDRAVAGAAASVPAVLAGLVAAAAFGAPWPTLAALSLACGLAAALTAGLAPAGPARGVAAVLAVACTGPGAAGGLATRAGTLAALGAVLVAGAVIGAAGRGTGTRVAGWLVATASGALFALAAALAAGAGLRPAALAVLAAAGLALLTSALLPAKPRERVPVEADARDAGAQAAGARAAGARERTAAEAAALEAAAHASALVALGLTAGSTRHAAAVATAWGLASGLRALRPGEPAAARRARIVAAIGCELLGCWLLLAASQVAVLEAYTLPAAAAALLVGWLLARGRRVRSWAAYGPALLAGFAPSAATLLVAEGAPLRRLGLGAAAVAVLVVGSLRRLQAPVVVAGAVLVVIALHELVLVWDALPRWIPLAAAGTLLVTLAASYERRRRDLTRLRGAVGRMR
jgi:hypothetical protein